MAQTGKTTANVKLRSGAGMQFEPPLAFLEPNTAMEVLGEDGDWLHVRVDGKEGYVGKKYVEVSGSAAPAAPAAAAAPPAAGSGMTKREPGAAPKSDGGGKAHKGVEEE